MPQVLLFQFPHVERLALQERDLLYKCHACNQAYLRGDRIAEYKTDSWDDKRCSHFFHRACLLY